MNINAEENYWLAENTNLSELHTPFLSFVENLEKTGRITAKTFYNANGWVCHHNSDIWAMTNPVGDFGKGDPVWANWAMGATWASTHLWEHYSYTKDKEFLKTKAYPLMRGAAEFCLDMLTKDKNGQYITAVGTSPENVYITDKGYKGATLYGATADLAMIRELFIDLIEATNVLGGDYDFKNKLEEVLANMYPTRMVLRLGRCRTSAQASVAFVWNVPRQPHQYGRNSWSRQCSKNKSRNQR
jgi:alpha-L-fucosidase 2